MAELMKEFDMTDRTALRVKRWSGRSALRRAYQQGDGWDILQAIEERVTITDDGCWNWPTIKGGYPRAHIAEKDVPVHRLALEAKLGMKLGNQAAHHICANSMCVNPDHLQPVTAAMNTAEMLARSAYKNRIRELEEALGELAPQHPLLDRHVGM